MRLPRDQVSTWVYTRRIIFVTASIMLLLCGQVPVTGAILNCFNPNMLRMGKVGMPSIYGASLSPHQQMLYGYQQMGYSGQNPIKSLFQPKWRSSSLFGGKGWGNWKMGSNSNFYRPGYGYGTAMPSPTGGYTFNEQLNVAPFSLPQSVQAYPASSSDGWSAPLSSYSKPQQLSPIQQTPLSTYDSFSALQPSLPSKQQVVAPLIDAYGAVKGGVDSAINNKFTTTKNTLVANGGYGAYDAYLMGNFKNRSYGYSYPDWYAGSSDSPARIAQQLLKQGLRRLPQQRLERQYNRSAPLMQDNSKARFTILDEPRFVGYGKVDASNTREVKLSCSFNEAIDQTNRPVWVKFLGTYNLTQTAEANSVPPFNCVSSQCRVQEVESNKDYRYTFDNGPATSTLIIAEPRLFDYGTYRCSALTKAINNNPLETVYQVVQFKDLI